MYFLLDRKMAIILNKKNSTFNPFSKTNIRGFTKSIAMSAKIIETTKEILKTLLI